MQRFEENNDQLEEQMSFVQKTVNRVTVRDPRTGMVVKHSPYTLRVVAGEGQQKFRYFEIPPGSGNMFNASGEEAGRWDATKPEGKRHLKEEKHIAFTPPETADEKLSREVLATKQENEALQKELQSLRADKKSAPAPAPAKKEQGA